MMCDLCGKSEREPLSELCDSCGEMIERLRRGQEGTVTDPQIERRLAQIAVAKGARR